MGTCGKNHDTQAQKHKLPLTDANKYNMQTTPYSPRRPYLSITANTLAQTNWGDY